MLKRSTKKVLKRTQSLPLRIYNVSLELSSRLKTGLFKWHKDYASAAMAFDDAGNFCQLILSTKDK